MAARTFALLALLALAACAPETTIATTGGPGPDPGGWRLSSGKEPSTAEFAALAASCQDKGGPMEPCLTDLGLKRAQ